MKKVYGIMPLVFSASILLPVFVALMAIIQRVAVLRMRSNAHAGVRTALLAVTCVLTAYVLWYTLRYYRRQYSLIILRDGDITFRSLNPFRGPVVFNLSDIIAMHLLATRPRQQIVVATRSGEQQLPINLSVFDYYNLSQRLAANGVQLSVSGTMEKYYTVRDRNALRVRAVIAMLIIYLVVFMLLIRVYMILHRHH